MPGLVAVSLRSAPSMCIVVWTGGWCSTRCLDGNIGRSVPVYVIVCVAIFCRFTSLLDAAAGASFFCPSRWLGLLLLAS